MIVLRRAAAVCLLILLAGGLAWTVVLPFVRLWADEGRDDRRLALAHLRQLASEAPAREQRIKALRAALTASDLLWHETSLAAGSSEIQGRIRAAFAQNGGEVQATTDLSPIQSHGLWRIGVAVDATATTAAFWAALASLESARPKLFVEDLRVQAEPASGPGTRAPALAVHLVVAGYGLPL
jgi:general secretion pathway protein M